jgi:hypothetical protein
VPTIFSEELRHATVRPSSACRVSLNVSDCSKLQTWNPPQSPHHIANRSNPFIQQHSTAHSIRLLDLNAILTKAIKLCTAPLRAPGATWVFGSIAGDQDIMFHLSNAWYNYDLFFKQNINISYYITTNRNKICRTVVPLKLKIILW